MKRFCVIFPLLLCGFILSAQASDKAVLRLFDAAYRADKGKNLMLSPWGIQQCYGMVRGGAAGKSLSELESVLGLNQQALDAQRTARLSMQKANSVFNSFNAVLFDRKYQLQAKFIRHSSGLCGGKLYRVDFTRQEECLELLNSIVKRESRGLFDKVFTPRDLEGEPAMILLNVLSFKDSWSSPFDSGSTRKEPFFVPGQGKVTVDMMNDSRYLPYYDDGTLHAIVLDCKERRFKMLVLTSKDKSVPLETVTRELASKGVRYFVSNASSHNETVIKLPKLELQSPVDLVELLRANGMSSLFDPQTADLSGMVQGSVPLYVSRSRQIIKLALHEQGTFMAAVTYMGIELASAPEEAKVWNHFHADHPFVLVLFDSETNSTLLVSAVVMP